MLGAKNRSTTPTMNFLITNMSVQHCHASRNTKSHLENRFREDGGLTDLVAFQQPLARILSRQNATTHARTHPTDTFNSRSQSPVCVGFYVLFIAGIFLPFFSCALANQENNPDIHSGLGTDYRGESTAEFQETLPNGDVYDVVIVMELLEKTCMMLTIFDDTIGKVWGIWDERIHYSNNYIRRFSVRYNGRVAPVPFSAYSDLAAVHAIKFNASSDGFTLHMDLVDASTSSDASFKFNRSGFLTKRRVWHFFIPENYFEETKYFPPE